MSSVLIRLEIGRIEAISSNRLPGVCIDLGSNLIDLGSLWDERAFLFVTVHFFCTS